MAETMTTASILIAAVLYGLAAIAGVWRVLAPFPSPDLCYSYKTGRALTPDERRATRSARQLAAQADRVNRTIGGDS